MRVAWQYRLYPTHKQAESLESLLEAGRQLYNAALEHRLLCWRRYRHTIRYLDQASDLKLLRREIPEIGELNFSACQQVLRRLEKNFQAFLKGQRGRPRFKSKTRFRSLEFRFGDGASLKENRLYIQNVGYIKVRWHRPLPQGAIKDVVITRHSDGKWFVTLRLELPDPKVPPKEGLAVGVDLGLESFAVLSTGERMENPRFLRKTEAQLREAQRRYSLNQSKRWLKRLRTLHAKVARQRKDFLHKLSRLLVERFATIVVEDLNVKGLSRRGNRGLRKSVYDASWGAFLQMLTYKAASAGGRLVKANPRGSSQQCAYCLQAAPKSLSERWHLCPHCGFSCHRDLNSALVILIRGLGRDAALRHAPCLRSSPL